MYGRRPKWRVCFELDEVCQLHLATVEVQEPDGVREVVHMHTGPFDSPEDVLSTILELIDHAEWRGEQLRLPVTPGQ